MNIINMSQQRQQSAGREGLGGGEEEESLLNSFSASTKECLEAATQSGPNRNTIVLYSLLVVLSLSLLLFNYASYRRSTQHHTLLATLVNSTVNQINESNWQAINSLNAFITQYTSQYNQLSSELQQITSSIHSTKERTARQTAQLQALHKSNAQDLASLNRLSSQYQAYAKEIRKYRLSDLQARTVHRPYFDANREEISYSNIESIVWVFSSTVYASEEEYLKKLYLHNAKYYAYISGFEFKVVTPNNYFYYLTPEATERVAQIVAKLEVRLSNHDRTNLGDHLSTIKRVLIMTSILYENGGVALIDELALAEPLQWLADAELLKTFNQGDAVPAQVVGFFNAYYSSGKVRPEGTSREIYRFPSLERSFIAAVRRSRLVGAMLDEMVRILESPFGVKGELREEQYDMGGLSGSDPYYEFFFISSQLVLQKKQRELDLIDEKALAIDYYGLYVLSSGLGPNKLKTFLANDSKAYRENSLLDTSRGELERKMGPIRFVLIFSDYWETNRLLLDIKNKKRTILLNCLVSELFYPAGANHGLTYTRTETYLGSNKLKPWSSLPRKVWIHDITEPQDLVGKLMINAHAKMNMEQGIEVRSFTSKTLESLLTAQVIAQVNEALKKSPFSGSSSLRDYMLILCLLSKEGGIYFDSSYLLLEDLRWVFNMGQVNESMVANRLGESPEILMFHNNHLRHSHPSSFDQSLHTRLDPLLPYDPSFIAVGKDSPLIDEWVEDTLRTLPLGKQQLQAKFASCGLKDQLLYTSRPEYLPVDILRCLCARGTGKLPRSELGKADNPYRVWSIDGDYSLYKISARTNYEGEGSNKNIYAVRQSQEEVEGKIGPLFKLIKLDLPSQAYLNEAYVGGKQKGGILASSIVGRSPLLRN